MYADIDWVQMSLAERIAPTQALYRTFMAVAKRQGIKGDLLLFKALGEVEVGGTDYLSNFRKGKIDKHKARDVHLWLAENHFDLAHETSPDLFPQPPMDAFQDFIDRHATTGKLRIIRLKGSMGLVERSGNKRDYVETLRLSERFCFELDTEINGVALAFQRYQGKWHPLPLGANQRRHKAEVVKGLNLLPQATNGKLIPLEENDDAGNHQFAAIIAKDRNLTTDIGQIARLGDQDIHFEVCIADVRFVT